MFTKNDIKNVLKKLRALEIFMNKKYTRMAKDIEDPKYKALFLKVASEEKIHEEEFNKLLEILEHWKT